MLNLSCAVDEQWVKFSRTWTEEDQHLGQGTSDLQLEKANLIVLYVKTLQSFIVVW